MEQLEFSIKQITTSGDKVIFDRCPIDFLAYIHALDESVNIQSIYTKVESIRSEIDFLVFVPIEEPELILCQESDFPELRFKANEILNVWFLNFGIETIEVKRTLLNRKYQILGKIFQEFKNKSSL